MQPVALAPKPPKTTDRILRIAEVRRMTGLSRTTIWRMEKQDQFPARVALGIGSVGWKMSEIQHWLDSRAAV